MSENAEPSILFFDTETTGMVNFKEEPTHPCQPDLIQLGLMLTDPMGQVRKAETFLVMPSKDIEPEAQAIHGISLQDCRANGRRLEDAMKVMDEMVSQANLLVAHNAQFDLKIIARARHIAGYKPMSVAYYCTMMKATKACGLKNARGGPKWPKLEEACRVLLKRRLLKAHDAIADVEACRLLYLHLRGLPVVESPYSALVPLEQFEASGECQSASEPPQSASTATA